MRFAYADPPYLGMSVRLYGDLHPEAAIYDTIEGHKALIDRLCSEFADGWVMSLHSPSLHQILPLCPHDCRVSAWVKPFASFKPGVGVAYAWEPVIWRGGRRRTREQPTIRDWCAANCTLQRGFPGAKPVKFIQWVLDILNAQPGDDVIDLFPGSGGVTDVISARINGQSRPTIGLFGEENSAGHPRRETGKGQC